MKERKGYYNIQKKKVYFTKNELVTETAQDILNQLNTKIIIK